MEIGSQSALTLGAPHDGTRLLPVLARALDTGRGPAGLLRLLRARGCESGGSGEALGRLAGDLGQVIRRAGVQETLAE